ncbi:MAG: hypothetical protein M3279_08750, partial [Actinomycetota bacterium]|nr:hypothetical protein [Actinomycetota bacterium]
MHVLVVGNPASSRYADDARSAIDRELPGVAWFTPGEGDLTEAARDAEVVVVAGGDGTLNHAVNALA